MMERVQISFRVGQGYDCHVLVEGRDLILGGVKIPHERGLMGHSDADVLLHAVIDALLGAAGLGDIGSHFPDSDIRYQGINSRNLLKKVWSLVSEAGYVISNIDATIIAQRPKLAPYIDQMKHHIADDLGIDISQVGIKAKTNEKLGFLGREEGIVAQAVTLLSKR